MKPSAELAVSHGRACNLLADVNIACHIALLEVVLNQAQKVLVALLEHMHHVAPTDAPIFLRVLASVYMHVCICPWAHSCMPPLKQFLSQLQ